MRTTKDILDTIHEVASEYVAYKDIDFDAKVTRDSKGTEVMSYVAHVHYAGKMMTECVSSGHHHNIESMLDSLRHKLTVRFHNNKSEHIIL